jgi:diguanylate cyclase (GGDEF)-like protein
MTAIAGTVRALRANWQLPRKVQVFIGVVVAAYLVGLVAVGLHTRFRTGDLATFAVFAIASILSVEVSLRLAWPRPRRDRIIRDFLGVWALPVMLLLPPFYAAAAVVLPSAYVQLRAFRADPVKAFFTVAALGIARAAGAAAHVAIAGHHGHAIGIDRVVGGSRDDLAVLAAVAAWWLVNLVLVGAVVSLSVGLRTAVKGLCDLEGVAIDLVDASMGLLAAIAYALRPELVLIAVAPVLYMQHQAFSGLRTAVRTDLLTDAASSQYWRETAGREVQRARASGTELAVLMIDIDHFKLVNDKYGHIAGDSVLTAVARTISTTLRPADLVGRLGGEEFAAVLTGSSVLDAEAAAQRVRTNVAAVRVRTDRGEWVSVTVSAGVAALGRHGESLGQLLDAADSALYLAKDSGRNAVRIAPHDRAKPIVLDLAEIEATRFEPPQVTTASDISASAQSEELSWSPISAADTAAE